PKKTAPSVTRWLRHQTAPAAARRISGSRLCRSAGGGRNMNLVMPPVLRKPKLQEVRRRSGALALAGCLAEFDRPAAHSGSEKTRVVPNRPDLRERRAPFPDWAGPSAKPDSETPSCPAPPPGAVLPFGACRPPDG